MNSIPEEPLSHLNTIANAVYVASIAMILMEQDGVPSEKRSGGYFSAIDVKTGWLEFTVRVGTSPEEKWAKRAEFSLEKCTRLYRNPGHLTSYESRNLKEDEFGGATRGKYRIRGFSGYPELWDEAVMFVSAILDGEIEVQEVLESIPHGRNMYLRPLLEATSQIE